MNQLLEWLTGGDVRSDGMADEAAAVVLQNPERFADLFEGLYAADDVVRGRSSDALEKVARYRPDLLIERLPELIAAGRTDSRPVVRMHIAMLLGHLVEYADQVETITTALLDLTADKSVFTRAWAIGSLTIIGRRYPQRRGFIAERIARLQTDSSIAIRSRVRKALAILTDDAAPFPKGWVKRKEGPAS